MGFFLRTLEPEQGALTFDGVVTNLSREE